MITKQQLETKHYYASDKLIRQINASLSMKPVPVIALRGNAGTGKSYLAETMAEILDAEFLSWQGYRGANENDLFFKIIPSQDTKAGVRMEEGILTKACDISHDRQVVILLDEWDKIRESADSSLLTFLQTGRITVEGVRTEANLSNLVVFIGMNNERPYGEYFLRRVSIIDFKPLKTDVVRRALEQTHPDHEQLDPALRLYDMSIKAELEKPATIQELRQLLTASTHLGDMADWDELVYQFVTKTPEAHEQLKIFSHQYQPNQQDDNEDRSIVDWDKSSFEDNNNETSKQCSYCYKYKSEDLISEDQHADLICDDCSQEQEQDNDTWMPKIKNVEFKSLRPKAPNNDTNDQKSLIIEDDDHEGYTEIIKSLKPQPSDDPNRLGKFERLDGVITSDDPLTIDEITKIGIDFEFYLEDRIKLHDTVIDKIISRSDKIIHYTNDELIIEEYDITIYLSKDSHGWYDVKASGEKKYLPYLLENYNNYHPAKKFDTVKCKYNELKQTMSKVEQYVEQYDLQISYKISRDNWSSLDNSKFSFYSNKNNIIYSLPYDILSDLDISDKYNADEFITGEEYFELANLFIEKKREGDN